MSLYNLSREAWRVLAAKLDFSDIANLILTCPALHRMLLLPNVADSLQIDGNTAMKGLTRLISKLPLRSVSLLPARCYVLELRGATYPINANQATHNYRRTIRALPTTVEALCLTLRNPKLSLSELKVPERFPKLHTLELLGPVSYDESYDSVIRLMAALPLTSLIFHTDYRFSSSDNMIGQLPPLLATLVALNAIVKASQLPTSLTRLEVDSITFNTQASSSHTPLVFLENLYIGTYEYWTAELAPNLKSLETRELSGFASIRSQYWPSSLQTLQFNGKITMDIIRALPTTLTSLTLRGQSSSSDSLAILHALPSLLKTLTIMGYQYTPSIIPRFTTLLPKIESLWICHSIPIYYLALLPTSVKHLDPKIVINDGSCFGDAGLDATLAIDKENLNQLGNPQLGSLISKYIPNIEYLQLEVWQPQPMALPNSIKTLIISAPSFSSAQLFNRFMTSQMDQMTLPSSLTSFDYRETYRMPLPQAFKNLPRNLSNLNFRTTYDVSNNLVDKISWYQTSEAFTELPSQLQYLQLWIRLPDAMFFSCLPSHLMSFSLRWTEAIYDKDILFLPRSLESLTLRDAIHLTDSCFPRLPPGLVRLDLHRNRLITPEALNSLPHKLESLWLSKNKNFPRRLRHGPKYGLKNLHTLKCSWQSIAADDNSQHLFL